MKKSKRRDRRKQILEAVSQNLDVRSQWLGIRQMMKKFTGRPYSRRHQDGTHIPMKQRAEEAAKFLESFIWSPTEHPTNDAQHLWPRAEYPPVINGTAGVDTSPISQEEVMQVVRKMKRRKAAGPDQVCIELMKEMDADNLREVTALLQKWWDSEDIPREALQARVVLIFKKGNANDLGNYRPISLLNIMYKIFAAVLQRRLAKALDERLQETQFGFRRRRSTADAIHCVRRVIDKGEMTNSKTLLVLLDWEKAFDKVSHVGLFCALERMGIETKIIKLIKELYSQPQFCVEIDGETSAWHTQAAGIRQGCPLSPYLFIILMTVLFKDVHRIHKPHTVDTRVTGTSFDEVLYADDTILISESERAVEKALAAIEKEGGKYGMKLNKAKCELLAFGQVRPIRLTEGSKLKPKEEVRYLGCALNNKADSSKELQKRIADCMVVLNNLQLFWRHGDSSIKKKLEVYNAVIKTKLIYGLESLQLTQASTKKLDTFQLKGLRKILKLETTYINSEYSNDYVYERATQEIRSGVDANVSKGVERLSHSYEKARLKLFSQLILAKDSGDPKEHVTFAERFKPHNYGTRRVGRPRLNWIKETTNLFWNNVVKLRNRQLWLGDFDADNDTHHRLIMEEAAAYIESYI